MNTALKVFSAATLAFVLTAAPAFACPKPGHHNKTKIKKVINMKCSANNWKKVKVRDNVKIQCFALIDVRDVDFDF